MKGKEIEEEGIFLVVGLKERFQNRRDVEAEEWAEVLGIRFLPTNAENPYIAHYHQLE